MDFSLLSLSCNFWLLSFLVGLSCFASILLMQRLLGLHGLYVYNVLAVLAGNIQVLKTISVPYYGAPVAMGTFLFGTTFLVSDIITEHYGQQKAKKGITLMFSAQVLLLIFMIPSLYYPAAGDEFSHKAHEAMETLFIPCVRILIASIIAFATSLWIDIKLFVWIKERTQDKWLYLRSNISSFVSSFLDNVIFSVLAWVILSPYSVTLETLLFTYILGTYGARALISIMCTPIIYLSYFTTSRR